MNFINETGMQVKFCVYKTSGVFDNLPCEGGVVFVAAKSSREWFPAPGEHNPDFDVRVFKPAIFDELLGRVANVNRGGRVKISPDHNVVLDNTLKYHNIEIPYPALVASPGSLNELVQQMTAAAAKRLKIRAVGGGYSFSDVAHTDGAFVYTHNMDKILPLDLDVLRPGAGADNLRKVEAGISVEKLNKGLWEQGKGLFNQGGYDKQTIFGALCTGTHGSGITLGSIASTVRSMHIVTLDGNWAIRHVQIEPTNGITEPSKHRRKYPNIELIQDDETFHSCTVCFGAMGIVYSAVIEVRDAYWLREDRIKQSWAETKSQLLGGIVRNSQYRHIEVLVNPYKDTTVLTRRVEVKATAPSGSRSFAQTSLAKITELTYAIQDAVNTNPALVPMVMDLVLDGTTDKDVVDRYYAIMNIGPANDLPGISSEIGIDATDINNVVRALDDINTNLKERGRTDGRYVTVPYAVRFVKADSAYLSMQYGRDTCMIEILSLSATYGFDETVRRIRNLLLQKYDGRPHWGQLLEIDAATAAKLYPKFDLFKKTYKKMNVSGAFQSAMTKRLGLD
jgi:L-gulono-1,4-lactone dehydrogenase